MFELAITIFMFAMAGLAWLAVIGLILFIISNLIP